MWQAGSLGGENLRLPLFYVGYFFIGGYRLCRSMALAYARSLVKVNETGLAYGLVETGNAISAIAAPLVAGVLYDRSPQWMYIATLVAIGISLLINYLMLPKRHRQSKAVQNEILVESIPAE